MIHASPQGTFKRLANLGDRDIIPIGRSDYGITTPAEHSAISLAQISVVFFELYSSADIALIMKHIVNWIDIIREEYFKVHDLAFPEEEKLWDESLLDN